MWVIVVSGMSRGGSSWLLRSVAECLPLLEIIRWWVDCLRAWLSFIIPHFPLIFLSLSLCSHSITFLPTLCRHCSSWCMLHVVCVAFCTHFLFRDSFVVARLKPLSVCCWLYQHHLKKELKKKKSKSQAKLCCSHVFNGHHDSFLKEFFHASVVFLMKLVTVSVSLYVCVMVLAHKQSYWDWT